MKHERFTYAVTRKPGQDFANGLTTSGLGKPDYTRICQQHAAYVNALQSLGLEVIVLEALPGYPDAYFVEDVAVVIAGVAVITVPGAAARKGEAEHIVAALAKYRPIERIQSPGTLDGGDVMLVEEHGYIGLSERTNWEGAAQLGLILQKYGYEWTAVPLAGGLHLKSDVNYIGRNTLLLTEPMFDMQVFAGYDKILVDQAEAYAANTLLVNGRLLTPQGFPRTKANLLAAGFEILELETSELQKMDGGLSCMSLRF
jgi:dimethylargininase